MNGQRSNLARRNFCAVAGSTLASLVFGSTCRRSIAVRSDGRLTARPRDANTSTKAGQIPLNLDRARDALICVPKTTDQQPLPLLVMLHGATQSAEDMFWYLDSHPQEAGVAVLAPHSRDTTWDAISDSFGPDIDFLNRALERVFETTAIDPARISVGGFSDGATYAISLGLINGDLFSKVAAFSPGFVVDGTPNGKPRFFISHGTRDHILPIARCGRRIASELKTRGYDVAFREFDGGHEIPPQITREGLQFVK